MPSRKRSHNVGTALHRLRRENGWTLSTVSNKTGVAVSTLSKIENNQTSPNYDVLVRLCDGLDLNLAEFFDGGSFATFAHGSRTVNRLGEGPRLGAPGRECIVLSGELSTKALHPRLIRVAKAADDAILALAHAHTGEEFVYVVSGSVRFYMEPYSIIELREGESVHFDARMRHGWAAAGDEAMTLVVAQTALEGSESARGSGSRIANLRIAGSAGAE